MRNLSVIKGLYQGNGVTRRWAIPFEYNDKSQIFVTITTFDEGDYTYRVLDRTEYTIDEDSVEIVYPKTDDDAPIPSTQYLTVWRDTDLLQLMDLTNQGAAWPDSIEASLDKLHQIVQELAEGLSRSLKVDIGDPQTPDEKLVAIQDYVLAAAESSRSASASEASAQRAAEAAATSEANAAESERLASGYADTATDAASRAEDSAISARAYNAPDYDNETTYQAGDVVSFTDGNSYRALQETTGNEPPNIIYWQKVTDYVGDDFFEVDEYGYIVPMDSPSHSRYWRVDQNGYIVPIEGGDGGYRPDTRSLSAEYLNVTNEGYVKHLRADDISAQEVDADEVTAEVAAFNTFTADAVNAGTLTANDVIAKGPIVDVRAFGAKGDGTTDDTSAIQAAIDYVLNNGISTVDYAPVPAKLYFPQGEYLISDTINITKAVSNFELDASSCIINYNGTGVAFYITGLRYSVLRFGTIKAVNGGGLKFYSANINNDWLQYNKIYFGVIEASTSCMLIESDDTGWINEFSVFGGRLKSGQYGVKFINNSATYINKWTFYNVGVEGVSKGFSLNNNSTGKFYDFIFIGCRTEEADNVLETSGICENCLWIDARPINSSKFALSQETLDFKFISAVDGMNVPQNADINDYIRRGIYYIYNHALASTIANLPEQKPGKLIVDCMTINPEWYIRQKYELISENNDNNNIIYERKLEQIGGTWTAWKRIDSDGLRVGNSYIDVTMSGNTRFYTAPSNGILTLTATSKQFFLKNETNQITNQNWTSESITKAGFLPMAKGQQAYIEVDSNATKNVKFIPNE